MQSISRQTCSCSTITNGRPPQTLKRCHSSSPPALNPRQDRRLAPGPPQMDGRQPASDEHAVLLKPRNNDGISPTVKVESCAAAGSVSFTPAGSRDSMALVDCGLHGQTWPMLDNSFLRGKGAHRRQAAACGAASGPQGAVLWSPRPACPSSPSPVARTSCKPLKV